MCRVFREKEQRFVSAWRQGDKKWRVFAHFGKESGKGFVPDVWFGGMPIKQAASGLEKAVYTLEKAVRECGISI